MAGLSPKEIRVVIKHLQDQNIRMKRTKNGYLVYLPDGKTQMIHLTPSDHKGHMSLRAAFKRAGVTWPTDAQLAVKEDFETELPSYITTGRPQERTLNRYRVVLDRMHEDGITEISTGDLANRVGGTKDYSGMYRSLLALDYEPIPGPHKGQRLWRKRPDLIPLKGYDWQAENEAAMTEAADAGVMMTPVPHPSAGLHPQGVTPGADKPDPSVPKEREFIDTHDSWTIEMRASVVAGMSVRDLRQTMNAAGLEMEIRVWKSDKPFMVIASPAPGNGASTPTPAPALAATPGGGATDGGQPST